MRKGFARWATQHFTGDELEAAFVFSNAYFVSFTRRYDTRAWTGKSPTGHGEMVGNCYSYQPEIARGGVYLARESRDTTAAIASRAAFAVFLSPPMASATAATSWVLVIGLDIGSSFVVIRFVSEARNHPQMTGVPRFRGPRPKHTV